MLESRQPALTRVGILVHVPGRIKPCVGVAAFPRSDPDEVLQRGPACGREIGILGEVVVNIKEASQDLAPVVNDGEE